MNNNKEIITGSRDQLIKFWNAETLSETCKPIRKHKAAVLCLALTRRGDKLISGSIDKSLCVFKLFYDERNYEIKECISDKVLENAHDDSISSIVTSKNYEDIFFSGSHDQTIKMWSIENSRCLKKFVGHIDKVLSLALVEGSNDKSIYIISGSRDSTIKWWGIEEDTKCFDILTSH